MRDDCPTCRTFAAENNSLALEIQALDADRKRLALENQSLRAQRTRRLREEELDRHVMGILRLAKALLGLRSIEVGGKHYDVARAAMSKFTTGTLDERRRECMDAVRGLALRPYTCKFGRTANPELPGAQRRAALRFALMDEEHIAEHAGFYRMAQAKPLEWKLKAWRAAGAVENRYLDLCMAEWRAEEKRARKEATVAEEPGKPQLHLVVDNTDKEAA